MSGKTCMQCGREIDPQSEAGQKGFDYCTASCHRKAKSQQRALDEARGNSRAGYQTFDGFQAGGHPGTDGRAWHRGVVDVAEGRLCPGEFDLQLSPRQQTLLAGVRASYGEIHKRSCNARKGSGDAERLNRQKRQLFEMFSRQFRKLED